VALSVAGCAATDLFQVNATHSQGSEDELTVPESLDDATRWASDPLRNFQVATVITRESEEVRIRCTAGEGAEFDVVLSPEQHVGVEQTHLRVEAKTRSHKRCGIAFLWSLGTLSDSLRERA
jgi:hypothetical protein